MFSSRRRGWRRNWLITASTRPCRGHAVSLLDSAGALLAGVSIPARSPASNLLPWTPPANDYEMPVAPVGNGFA